jgi:thiol-disulfide isomerase/thioredoxin
MQGKSVRLVAGLLVTLAAAGCAGKAATNVTPGPDTNVQGGRGIAGLVDLTHHDFHVGNVSGTALTGSQVSLAKLPGKLTVVNFWGSWCAPCIAEEQSFAALAKTEAPKGVSFLGIDERDNTAAALAFERKYGVTYPSIADPDASMLLAFPGAVPSTTPTTILVDSTGHILAKVSGMLEYTDLRSLVNHYRAVAT